MATKAKTRKKATKATKAKTRPLQMNAFEVQVSRSNLLGPVPIGLLEHFRAKPFQDRWDNPREKGQYSRNILNLQLLSPAQTGRVAVFHGKLVEVHCREKLDLIDFTDGSETELNIPANKGEKATWEFMIAPEKSLLVLEQKGLGAESKLQDLLTKHSHDFPGEKIDAVFVEAIPREADPVGFLRRNPDLGSFEAVLDARAIHTQEYGFFCGLFKGLSDEETELRVKIEISAGKRGGELPRLLTTRLADFLNGIEDDNLKKASVKEVVDGRRASRPTRLLNAILTHSVEVAESEDTARHFLDFMLEAIDLFEGEVGN